MARVYDMQRRSSAAAETRAAIIEAAHALLNSRDGDALTIQNVAAAAGVSRATVYNSVGSRRDLLSAVFEDQGRLIAFSRVLAASRLDDPAEAIVRTVRESARAWSVIPDAIRTTLALAAIDREAGELVQRYEQYRRAELSQLAQRAHKAGLLRAGLSAREAAATIALLTSFAAFDHLRFDHRTSAVTEHLVRMARRSLGITSIQE